MAGATSRPPNAARQFLELYYPIHYRAGIGVEDALRGRGLGRHQVAILWLIHAEGVDGRSLDRKRIQRALTSWFGISPAAVTKALNGMSTAPRKLLRLEGNPASGREKLVILTAAGERQLQAMIGRGTAHVQRIIDEMDDAQVLAGLAFFEKITAIIDGWDGR